MRFQKGACVLEVIENASIHSRPHYRFRFDAFSTGCPLEKFYGKRFLRMLLKRGTGSGERGTGNGERKSGNELSAETSIKIQYGR